MNRLGYWDEEPVRSATLVVAANDSLDKSKAQADYVCDGVADNVEIQAAIDAIPSVGGKVVLLEGTYVLAATITLQKQRLIFDASFTIIQSSLTSYAFNLIGIDATTRIRESQLLLGQLIATGDAITSATAVGVRVSGWTWGIISGVIENFHSGVGIKLDAVNGAPDYPVYGLTFPKLFCRACKIGVEFAGDGPIHFLTFGQYWWSPGSDATTNYGIKDNNTHPAAPNSIRIEYAYLETAWTNPRGIDVTGNDVEIGILVWDGSSSNIVIASTERIKIDHISREHGAGGYVLDSQLDIPIESEVGRRLPANAISIGSVLHIPTNAGWTASNLNGGSIEKFVAMQLCQTFVTANARALLWARFHGFNVGGNPDLTNWDRKLYYSFGYCRYGGSDAQVVARVQIKTVNTEGALGAKGIGIRVENFDIYGESYGTALGSVNLGLTLVATRMYHILIVLDPDTREIQWWIDSGSGLTLLGTQTTAANIPTALSTGSYLVHSIVNGATGGVNCSSKMYRPKVWQGLE